MPGDVVTGWDWKTVDEVAEVIGGGTPSTKDPANFGGDIPWITPNDLATHQSRYIERGERNISESGLRSSSARLLPAGTVLLSSRAPIGYVAIAANPVSTNQGFRSRVLRDGNVPEFFYYLMSSSKALLESRANGTTFKEISGSSLKQIRLLVPPIKEQQAIASMLGVLDDKIQLNRRMNETLESIAQTLFRSWFVDFDPVRAKADGREPYGMDCETASHFPSAFQPSKLGDIPLDWQIAPLTAHVEILGGGTPKTSVAEFWGGGIPWVSVVDTVPGPYIIRTAKTVSETAVARGAAKMLPAETVVLTARGTVGNSALMAVPMSMNQSCYGLRGKDGVGQVFLLQRTRDQVAQLKASSHGSVFDTITTQTLNGLLVVWPATRCMEAFEDRARPLFDQILADMRQSLTLEAIRNALLPKLLSGELRVTDAEQLVGAIV